MSKLRIWDAVVASCQGYDGQGWGRVVRVYVGTGQACFGLNLHYKHPAVECNANSTESTPTCCCVLTRWAMWLAAGGRGFRCFGFFAFDAHRLVIGIIAADLVVDDDDTADDCLGAVLVILHILLGGDLGGCL